MEISFEELIIIGGIYMACPKCGSNDIEIIKETQSETKGYGLGKGCCGYMIFGPWGWLCGLLGMGKGRTETNVYRMCKNCGARFK